MNNYKPNNDIYTLYQKLKKHFRIYAYEDNFTNFILENKNGIARISKKKYYHEILSTIHKANKITGTGYQLLDNKRINKKDVEMAIKTTTPMWEKEENINTIIKYKSFKDYIKEPINQILKYKLTN